MHGHRRPPPPEEREEHRVGRVEEEHHVVAALGEHVQRRQRRVAQRLRRPQPDRRQRDDPHAEVLPEVGIIAVAPAAVHRHVVADGRPAGDRSPRRPSRSRRSARARHASRRARCAAWLLGCRRSPPEPTGTGRRYSSAVTTLPRLGYRERLRLYTATAASVRAAPRVAAAPCARPAPPRHGLRRRLPAERHHVHGGVDRRRARVLRPRRGPPAQGRHPRAVRRRARGARGGRRHRAAAPPAAQPADRLRGRPARRRADARRPPS